MHDSFELPVFYKGEECLFPARLEQTGYSHRFVVNIYEVEVIYEPDEQRNYRALVGPEMLNKQVTVELLGSVAEAIESVVR